MITAIIGFINRLLQLFYAHKYMHSNATARKLSRLVNKKNITSCLKPLQLILAKSDEHCIRIGDTFSEVLSVGKKL